MTRRATRPALAVLFALWCSAALAADLGPPGQGGSPMTFQADQVEYDDQLSLTVARGHVEISQNSQILLADVVTYSQRTDTVTASGHVSLLLPTGDIIFSDYMELRDSMNNAFAGNVRMLLSDRSRMAANTARRVNGNRLEMRKVVYSPCDLCKDDPTKPPAWQLRAREVSHDKDEKLIEYRDAVMEIDGWPILYTPYMSQPDPSVKRASGFLTPSFGGSSTLGAHFAIPYYQVLGPSADLTLTPRFTSQAGTLLAGDYRQRFSNGELDAIASVNYSNIGQGTTETVDHGWRGHIDTHAVWDLDETYRTGFQIQRVSDQTYLQRFSFGNPFTNSMITSTYLEGFPTNGEFDVRTYLFQPLTPGLVDQTQPIVLPVINRTWAFEPDKVGGTLKFNTNFLNIMRETGTQTRRLSLGTGWERSFRDGIGGEYTFSATLRADGYSVNSLSNISNPDLPSAYFPQNGSPATQPIPLNYTKGRAFPQLGLVWDYPVVHRGEDLSFLVQPTAALFAGPSGGNSHRIPNEDSLGFEYRDSDLFRANRMQGYDLLDTGQRVDYGLKLGAYAKEGGSYRMLIGQSYRAETNSFLPPGTGADQRLSDIVGRVTLSPSSYLDLIYRFRLDKSTLGNRLQEVGATVGPQSLRFGTTFLLIPPEQASDVITVPGSGQTILYGKREQLSVSVTSKLTQYWTLAASQTLNLSNSSNIVNGVATPQSNSTSLNAQLAAIYQDECMAFIGSITQSGIRNGDVTPGVSVMFSVLFKNIGEIGGNVLSVAPTTH